MTRPADATSVRRSGRRGTSEGRRRRVLLIEDEPRIAEVVAEMLAGDGHEVVVAEDGDVGLFLATTEPFDLVILDPALPGASGFEIVRRVRQAHANVPVIVHSAHDDPSVRRACRLVGASAFVPKPLVVKTFRATVHAQLRSRAAVE